MHTTTPFAPIEEAIEQFRQGRMVIIVDDEDRENEGDLAIAAEKVTPTAINFMARFGRGLNCLAMTEERCRQLELPLIYVTHDQTEALTFADRVVVMTQGEVVQVGTPEQLFESPAHRFVGHFIGSPGMNFLECDGQEARMPGAHGRAGAAVSRHARKRRARR